MSGQGGWKHRHVAQKMRRRQKAKKARENISRARGLFEAKGQTWDPRANPAQMAALNHDGRRHAVRSDTSKH